MIVRAGVQYIDLHTPLIQRCGPVPWADNGTAACPLCAPKCKALSVHYQRSGYEVIARLVANATGLLAAAESGAQPEASTEASLSSGSGSGSGTGSGSGSGSVQLPGLRG